MDFKTKRLIRRLERQVKKLGGELEVDIIDTKHQNNLWYGGDIAEIKYKNHRLVIAAVGDVKVEVADENDNYVGYVKDKNNAGIFYKEFRHFIRDDKLLADDEEEQCIEELRQTIAFMDEAPKAIIEYDHKLFNALIKRVLVEENRLVFELKCGITLRETIAWN